MVEYKYVICDNEGRAVRWEERANRSFRLQELVAKQVIGATDAGLTLIEGFNSMDVTQWQDEGRHLGRIPSMRQESASKPNAGELFAPTIRERCYSQSMLTDPDRGLSGSLRSCSRSNLGTLLGESEPEVTGTNSQGMEPAEGVRPLGQIHSDTAISSSNALVREESCSNLFLDSGADEDLPEEISEFEDRYALVGNGPLGEGTFGLVWRCHPKPGSAAVDCEGEVQERAAKIVRKARLQPREMRYLLGEDGEIQIHLTMKHPHIVELFEFFDEALTVTLVLEYCRGGDLFDAVVRQAKMGNCRGFSEQAAAVVTRHLLSALAYVHEANVVHRDLKCENVLLCEIGVPVEENIYKLCDFGFAARDRGDGLSDRLGSPDTVAPDVLAGKPYSTPADIWSAGVLIYMMLSATPPFSGNSDAEVLRKVRNGAYSLIGDPWDSMSEAPKQMISSMMTVDSASRVTAVEALKAAWLTEQA